MIIDEALQGSRNGQEEEEPISCSSPGSAPLSSGSAGASPGQRRKESCRDEGPSQSCSSNSTLAAKAEEPCFPPSAPSPSPSPPHTKAMGESCGSNGAEDIAQMLREKDQRIKELEQVISELKRETLLPCKLCGLQDANGVNVTRPSIQQRMFMERDACEWGLLADTLLLVKPIWESSKATRIVSILPLEENRDLDPLALVERSNDLICELKLHLEQCERLKDAAREADSSLFSLFPFSAGTFHRVAQSEISAGERSGELVTGLLNHSMNEKIGSSSKNGKEKMNGGLHVSQNYKAAKCLEAAELENKGTAVEVANCLLMEMAQALLDQRLEINAYIEEIVRRAVDKEREMIDKDSSLIRKRGIAELGRTKPSLSGSESYSMDDFLCDQEIEEDAAEVEL